MNQTLAELGDDCNNGLELLSAVATEPDWVPIISDNSTPLKRSLQEQSSGFTPRKKRSHTITTKTSFPMIEHAELFERLATGQFQNIVVLTGAGISTAAGVPDFRSPDVGLFTRLRHEFGHRFPEAAENPECLLSRSFFNEHTVIWRNEVWPIAKLDLDGIFPTVTHRFCAWLEQQGWLKRIYTQNIDGLHTHPSLLEKVPSLRKKVVECHGSLERGDLVLYEDDLPKEFYDACNEDFHDAENPVDLLLVFGTSLQVSPFCAVPNLAPKGCVRVLVNRRLDECLKFNINRARRQRWTTPLGMRKAVSLRPLWADEVGQKRWRQLLAEGDCDDFCRSFFDSKHSHKLGHSLHQV